MTKGEEAVANKDPMDQTMQDVFTTIHRENAWHDQESVSGSGSSLRETQHLIQELPELLRFCSARSILDAPCGDLNWIKRVDLRGIHYWGVDIVPELLVSRETNDGKSHELRDWSRQPNAPESIVLSHKNILTDKLPIADVIFVRDCFVHFPNALVKRAIRNIQQQGFKWLATTTFTCREENENIKLGEWRPLNLCAPPFNFPEPSYVLNERLDVEGGAWCDKSIGLWPLDAITSRMIAAGRRKGA